MIFSGASALPAPLLRVIAAASGVTLYADCSQPQQHDCTIHAAGNGLYIHAGSRAGVRHITLPEPMLVHDEEGQKVCATPCNSFDASLGPAESKLYYVRREHVTPR